MKSFIYALKDEKIGFMAPQVQRSDAIAIRAFENILRDPSPNIVALNPGDFSLYRLGEYDEETGCITSKVEYVTNSAEILNK